MALLGERFGEVLAHYLPAVTYHVVEGIVHYVRQNVERPKGDIRQCLDYEIY